MNKYKEDLESMVWQFGYRGTKGGRLMISTGGLSALEEAFSAIGWEDPHYVDDPSMECDVEGCHDWRSPQIHWDGVYSLICDSHFRDYCDKKPRPPMKQTAIDREASRDPVTRRLP
ncbi:hypothetical protein LCGC14_1570370 [marine sediment metagenome]|uniref:Uncharacterized protein n=1 Tax=marine sediment metagenome TaxID=412755 RepID=A0A0F9IJT1_9ZZZZ